MPNEDMRLLKRNDAGEICLIEVRLGDDPPPYAILSHTWGAEEVTFEDLTDGTGKNKVGYEKIRFCGDQASRDGLQYFWIDTCCIKKSNSTELQEAINSMFRWYKKSAKCYVYLADVPRPICDVCNKSIQERWKPAFRKSRWFTRGWTLQELIAPASVEFFSKEGVQLGSKRSLEQSIHEITGIPLQVLQGGSLSGFSIQERMDWTRQRQTTREEDKAYSLLGIFNVYMPLLYGEGEENALNRLHRKVESALSRRTAATTNQPMIEKRGALTNDQKKTLLNSLRFEQIDSRQLTIKNAHTKTCKWLLQKSEYLDWLDPTKLEEHHGFLWIKGKPGAGKSTLMKSVFLNARKKMKDKIIISFFFNARGDELEKSTLGMYRSLSLQLLEQVPALQNVFDALGLASWNGGCPQWSVESLKTLFEQAVHGLGEFSLVCLIDALDECDEHQIRDMLSFFQRIGEMSVPAGIQFQVLLSSRHYPHITVAKGLSFVLEGQEGHTQDIVHYLDSELKIGHAKIADKIRTDLQEKAAGVFMWVVLVVGILNKEYDDGRLHALQKRLRDIPADLHELFRDILMRDQKNKGELLLCIQWVLFAKQSLKPEQLYFAILTGVEPETVSEWDREEITSQDMKRFILNSSKGLAEITASKSETVQFIHESVRDFLLKVDGMGEVWPELRGKFQGESHERLKKCCLDYMNIGTITSLNLSNYLPKASSQEAVRLRQTANERFPFLEYATRNVLFHMDKAAENNISQVEALQSFQLCDWIILDNLFQIYDSRRHTSTASLLYILAESNMGNLITSYSSNSACFEVENERYGSPILAAVVMESHAAVQALLRAQDKILPPTSSLYGRWKRYSPTTTGRTKLSSNFKFSRRRSLLSHVAEHGDGIIAAYLLALGSSNIDSKEKDGRTPFLWAAGNGHVGVAQLLLDKGANVNAQGGHYGTALQAASWGCHQTIVQLLLDNGADVNAQGGHYGTALQAASAEDQEKIVQLLLDNGADVNAQGGHYGMALQAASWRCHQTIVQLLLDNGADVNAQGGYYGTALQAASAEDQEKIVQLLLDNGANVNAQGGHYGTALQVASAEGQEKIVQLLLDNGANINAQGGLYRTALQAASAQGCEKIVQLLLDKGADVNIWGGHYGTALQAASERGHEKIVQLLLDRSAINCR